MRSIGAGKRSSDHSISSEEALRTIWRLQYFLPHGLRTIDGRPVAIVSPGTQNNDGGPDFTGARIRIGAVTFVGDVELHLTARSWFSHRHHTDSHYNAVVLHVVLDAADAAPPALTASKRIIPLLVLRPFLHAQALESPWPAARPQEPVVRCAPYVHDIPGEFIAEWIRTLALRRIEAAVRRFEDRLYELVETDGCSVRDPRQVYHGPPDEIPAPARTRDRAILSQPEVWDQLLYEAVMEGLGFTKNRIPFHALAESLPLRVLRRHSLGDLDTQLALLFGTAGLLPSPRGLPDPQSRRELRRLRKRWRELRHSLHRPNMHEAEWLFFRLRPANFPTARLAAVCHLLPAMFPPNRGFRIFLQEMRERSLSIRMRIREMRRVFTIAPSQFWQTHTHFRGRRAVRGIAIGASRKNEIIVNGIVPLLLLWARLFDEKDLESDTMTLLESIPASHSRVVQTMKEVLVRNSFPIRSALTEQGLLECYNRYCLMSRCGECGIGVAGRNQKSET